MPGDNDDRPSARDAGGDRTDGAADRVRSLRDLTGGGRPGRRVARPGSHPDAAAKARALLAAARRCAEQDHGRLVPTPQGARNASLRDQPMPALFVDLMATIARHLPALTPAQVEALSEPLRLLAEACTARPGEAEAQRDPPMAALLVERARHAVQENLSDPNFGPAQLCRLLAVSRSKLYRIFSESGGVAAFVQRERLHRARMLLAERPESRSINLVAAQVGFADHSTFSRAFRREFGLSPSEAREIAFIRHLSGSRRDGNPDVQ